MTILFTNTAQRADLTAPMRDAVDIIHTLSVRLGHPVLTITSTRNGDHMDGSLHYSGDAADIRIHGWSSPTAFHAAIRRRLDKRYDVVLETDHIHVEFDPYHHPAHE